MKKIITINIDERLNGLTIKELLVFFHVGRGKIEEFRVNKTIYLNDEQIDLSTKVKKGDKLVFVSEENQVNRVNKPVKVLYEDDDFIAVYKEKGLLVHSDGNEKDTLIFRVSSYLDDSIVYPVNRIDVDTSGIVLFAKHFLSSASINNMVENHMLTKEYLLKVKGILKTKKGKLEFYLGRDRHNSKKMIVKSKDGLLAITKYEVLEEYKDSSLIKARIITGRKHQIRVSFAHINHPLIGDKLYGNQYDKNELNLEAYHLSFISPITNKEIDIKTK